MANLKYNEKDIPQFKQEVCPDCVLKGKCIEEGKDNHWFLMCPHYHQWKVGYKSFVAEQLKWQREHPEEAEKIHKEEVRKAKAVKEQMVKEGKITTKKKTKTKK